MVAANIIPLTILLYATNITSQQEYFVWVRLCSASTSGGCQMTELKHANVRLNTTHQQMFSD